VPLRIVALGAGRTVHDEAVDVYERVYPNLRIRSRSICSPGATANRWWRATASTPSVWPIKPPMNCARRVVPERDARRVGWASRSELAVYGDPAAELHTSGAERFSPRLLWPRVLGR